MVTAELSSTMAAAEKTGIPRTTIAYWLDDPAFVDLRRKTREESAEGFDVLIHMAQGRLQELIPQMEPRDLVTLLGVATDKAQLVSGKATARTETKELTEGMNDHEREALRKVLETVLEEVPA